MAAEPNCQLRALRQSAPSRQFPGRTMSRAELAHLVAEHVYEHHGVVSPADRKYIAKLETGVISWPNARYREALRAVLGVPSDRELGFVSANTLRAAERLDAVDRRALLRSAALFGGAAVLGPSSTIESLGRAFEASFGEQVLTVDDWLAKAASYGEDYMSVGAADLQARLAGELVRLNVDMIDAPVLWGVAARLLTVTGKTLPSVDGPAGALHWYRLGVQAADRSQDPDVRVWVRGRSALALAYEGKALPVARALAQQALTLARRPSLGRLNAEMALAHVQGLEGDHAGALLTWNRARRTFDVAGSHEQVSDFAVPEWRMATFSSMLMARLGEERLALSAQETADRTRPRALPRFATHIELHRGLMMVNRGDTSEGLGYAHSALNRLPPERHSLSLKLMIAEIEEAADFSARGN